ncbi:MAG: hypothetical protein ACRDS0_07135 [Pseudonocardiaceae bacterium]
MRNPTAAVVAVVVGLLLTGCTDPDPRGSYLREVAARGVDAHHQLHSQGAHIDHIDPNRCSQTFAGLSSNHGLPPDDAGPTSAGWRQQVEATFVDSCVSGQAMEALIGGAWL